MFFGGSTYPNVGYPQLYDGGDALLSPVHVNVCPKHDSRLIVGDGGGIACGCCWLSRGACDNSNKRAKTRTGCILFQKERVFKI